MGDNITVSPWEYCRESSGEEDPVDRSGLLLKGIPYAALDNVRTPGPCSNLTSRRGLNIDLSPQSMTSLPATRQSYSCSTESPIRRRASRPAASLSVPCRRRSMTTVHRSSSCFCCSNCNRVYSLLVNPSTATSYVQLCPRSRHLAQVGCFPSHRNLAIRQYSQAVATCSLFRFTGEEVRVKGEHESADAGLDPSPAMDPTLRLLVVMASSLPEGAPSLFSSTLGGSKFSEETPKGLWYCCSHSHRSDHVRGPTREMTGGEVPWAGSCLYPGTGGFWLDRTGDRRGRLTAEKRQNFWPWGVVLIRWVSGM